MGLLIICQRGFVGTIFIFINIIQFQSLHHRRHEWQERQSKTLQDNAQLLANVCVIGHSKLKINSKCGSLVKFSSLQANWWKLYWSKQYLLLDLCIRPIAQVLLGIFVTMLQQVTEPQEESWEKSIPNSKPSYHVLCQNKRGFCYHIGMRQRMKVGGMAKDETTF